MESPPDTLFTCFISNPSNSLMPCIHWLEDVHNDSVICKFKNLHQIYSLFENCYPKLKMNIQFYHLEVIHQVKFGSKAYHLLKY